MRDSDDHLHLDGAPRCARAFCANCIKKFAGVVQPHIALSTCPYHILQSRSEDFLASQGTADKVHDTDDTAKSPSLVPPGGRHEPGPSSNGAGAP